MTAWKRLQSYPLRVQLTLAVYAIAFLNGTAVHLYVILIGWQLPHHPYVTAYWTSLTVLDPLAVVLIIFAPRKGLLLALVIMLTDVAINSGVTYMELPPASPYAVDYAVQLQTAFLGFVLGSIPFLWRYLGLKDAA